MKRITVPDEYYIHLDHIENKPLSDAEKWFLEALNFFVGRAYRAGYRDRGIFTRIKRRITRK